MNFRKIFFDQKISIKHRNHILHKVKFKSHLIDLNKSMKKICKIYENVTPDNAKHKRTDLKPVLCHMIKF